MEWNASAMKPGGSGNDAGQQAQPASDPASIKPHMQVGYTHPAPSGRSLAGIACTICLFIAIGAVKVAVGGNKADGAALLIIGLVAGLGVPLFIAAVMHRRKVADAALNVAATGVHAGRHVADGVRGVAAEIARRADVSEQHSAPTQPVSPDDEGEEFYISEAEYQAALRTVARAQAERRGKRS